MRIAAIALALAGCNSILGLSPTRLSDAPQLDVYDARPGHGQLSWWMSLSMPNDEISFVPITDAKVQVGALDGDLLDVANAADGFEVNQPPGMPYRLVYTLPGDTVPHEIQWAITASLHLTVPEFGRLARKAPPAGAGYTWTLANSTTPYPCLPSPPNPPCISQRTGLTVFTTGTWMAGTASYSPTANTLSFNDVSFKSLTGLLDDLDPTVRDSFVLVHYNGVGQADGYAAPIGLPPLQGGTFSNQGSILIEQQADGNAELLAYQPQPFPDDSPIMSALGGLYDGATAGNEAIGGVLPNFVMPAMTIPGSGGFDSSVFFPMDHHPNPIATNCFSYAWPWNPKDMSPDEFRPPAVVYHQYDTRPASSNAGAPTLYSGFQAVSAALRLANCASQAGPMVPEVTLDVGIATGATFGGAALTTNDTPVSLAQHSFAKLTFSLDPTRAAKTSDCIVTAYRVDDPAGLVPLRSILVLAAEHEEVHFPADDFMNSTRNVFGIVCRNGYPNAAVGDYTVFAGLPQQESQIFPGTFITTVN